MFPTLIVEVVRSACPPCGIEVLSPIEYMEKVLLARPPAAPPSNQIPPPAVVHFSTDNRRPSPISDTLTSMFRREDKLYVPFGTKIVPPPEFRRAWIADWNAVV